ncbi:MAG: DUF4399 domain-containing protein [Cyanobacteria bacterium J06632_3]
MKHIFSVLSVVLVALVGWMSVSMPAVANEYASSSPAGAKVYIISPQDGDTVTTDFTVQFGLSGMGIAPAGVDKAGTGHHHLLVDLETLPNLDEALSATEHIKHFGGGQTEASLALTPGKHTLQLVFANYAHIPHTPAVVSEPISITVE